jgi:hypothetical protein
MLAMSFLSLSTPRHRVYATVENLSAGSGIFSVLYDDGWYRLPFSSEDELSIFLYRYGLLEKGGNLG